MMHDPLFLVVARRRPAPSLGVLMLGIGSFGKGGEFNRQATANRLMRWRIGAQVVAVLLILLFVWLRGREADMVVLNRIYTRTGDTGETALGNGARVAKHALARRRPTARWTRANAAVGLARLHAEGEIDAQLARIQNDLFDLGADLCRPTWRRTPRRNIPPLRMVEPR